MPNLLFEPLTQQCLPQVPLATQPEPLKRQLNRAAGFYGWLCGKREFTQALVCIRSKQQACHTTPLQYPNAQVHERVAFTAPVRLQKVRLGMAAGAASPNIDCEYISTWVMSGDAAPAAMAMDSFCKRTASDGAGLAAMFLVCSLQ